MVFILNPVDLNRMSYPKNPQIFNAQLDEEIIAKYLKLGARDSVRGPRTIALNPVWNSERLMLQKGVFTLHGSRFRLDGKQAPSLVGLPILRECKARMLLELGRVGVDEMSIFPELEHSCSFLIKKARLVPER
jgi:hypothetical protein